MADRCAQRESRTPAGHGKKQMGNHHLPDDVLPCRGTGAEQLAERGVDPHGQAAKFAYLSCFAGTAIAAAVTEQMEQTRYSLGVRTQLYPALYRTTDGSIDGVSKYHLAYF